MSNSNTNQHIYIHKRNRAWIWVALILLAAGIAVYFLFLKPQSNDTALRVKIDSLEVEILIRELQIDSVMYRKDTFIDTLTILRKENERLKTEYNELLAEKKDTLEKIQTIPANRAYTLLTEEVYPDKSCKKPYPFTSGQVKAVYGASVALSYLGDQVALLNTRLAVREQENTAQDSVIFINEAVLDMQGEIIEDQDEQLEIAGVRITDRDKKIRRTRIASGAIIIGSFLAGLFIGGN